MKEHPNCKIGKWDGECRGRIFGGFKDCPHGWFLERDSLEQKLMELNLLIAGYID